MIPRDGKRVSHSHRATIASAKHCPRRRYQFYCTGRSRCRGVQATADNMTVAYSGWCRRVAVKVVVAYCRSRRYISGYSVLPYLCMPCAVWARLRNTPRYYYGHVAYLTYLRDIHVTASLPAAALMASCLYPNQPFGWRGLPSFHDRTL